MYVSHKNNITSIGIQVTLRRISASVSGSGIQVTLSAASRTCQKKKITVT